MERVWKDRRRRLRRFKIVEGRSRVNPASLRQLIFELIAREFDGYPDDAAAKFAANLKKAHPRSFRTKARGITGEALYQVCLDRHMITYSQLDAIALQTELPLGLLLLFTRVKSEVAQSDIEGRAEAQYLLTSAAEAIDYLHRRVNGAKSNDPDEIFDYAAFQSFQEIYSSRLKDLQNRLV